MFSSKYRKDVYINEVNTHAITCLYDVLSKIHIENKLEAKVTKGSAGRKWQPSMKTSWLKRTWMDWKSHENAKWQTSKADYVLIAASVTKEERKVASSIQWYYQEAFEAEKHQVEILDKRIGNGIERNWDKPWAWWQENSRSRSATVSDDDNLFCNTKHV